MSTKVPQHHNNYLLVENEIITSPRFPYIYSNPLHARLESRSLYQLGYFILFNFKTLHKCHGLLDLLKTHIDQAVDQDFLEEAKFLDDYNYQVHTLINEVEQMLTTFVLEGSNNTLDEQIENSSYQKILEQNSEIEPFCFDYGVREDLIQDSNSTSQTQPSPSQAFQEPDFEQDQSSKFFELAYNYITNIPMLCFKTIEALASFEEEELVKIARLTSLANLYFNFCYQEILVRTKLDFNQLDKVDLFQLELDNQWQILREVSEYFTSPKLKCKNKEEHYQLVDKIMLKTWLPNLLNQEKFILQTLETKLQSNQEFEYLDQVLLYFCADFQANWIENRIAKLTKALSQTKPKASFKTRSSSQAKSKTGNKARTSKANPQVSHKADGKHSKSAEQKPSGSAKSGLAKSKEFSKTPSSQKSK